MNKTKVYVVYDNSVIDYDASCTGVVGVFSTIKNAKTALKLRAETYADIEERWKFDENQNEEWVNDDDRYEIFEEGYYAQNHVEITIEEKFLDDPLFLS